MVEENRFKKNMHIFTGDFRGYRDQLCPASHGLWLAFA